MANQWEVYFNQSPQISDTAYIAADAHVSGDVEIGADSSVWPMAVLRGDVNRIVIGERTSIQDGTICHVSHAGDIHPEGAPLIIGSDVTVGHQVMLHGCTIQDRVLIGVGTIILDHAIIESDVMIGAGSLVPPKKHLESGYLYMGRPAKPVRLLTEAERSQLTYSSQHYVRLKTAYQETT